VICVPKDVSLTGLTAATGGRGAAGAARSALGADSMLSSAMARAHAVTFRRLQRIAFSIRSTLQGLIGFGAPIPTRMSMCPLFTVYDV
jgi:hypothetical protein